MWIVKTEHRSLLERPGGAEASRVIGVAFDLGGASVVAAYEKPGGKSVELHGRRVGLADAGRHFPRHDRVRKHLARSLALAAARAGKGDAGAEELQDFPPIDAFAVRRGVGAVFRSQPFGEALPIGAGGLTYGVRVVGHGVSGGRRCNG